MKVLTNHPDYKDRIIKHIYTTTPSPYGPRPLQITALTCQDRQRADKNGTPITEPHPGLIHLDNEYGPLLIENYELEPILKGLINLGIELGWLPPDTALNSPVETNELKLQMKARQKFKQLIQIHLNKQEPTDQFELGQIMGAQQACAWLAFDFMEPIKTTFGNDFIDKASKSLLDLAVSSGTDGVQIEISGQWLIDNHLIDLWCRLRDLTPDDITPQFTDKISYTQAQIIGLVGGA